MTWEKFRDGDGKANFVPAGLLTRDDTGNTVNSTEILKAQQTLRKSGKGDAAGNRGRGIDRPIGQITGNYAK